MYLETNNRRSRSHTRIITIVAIIAIVVVVLLQIFLPHFFAVFFTSIAQPFWRMEFAVSSGSLKSSATLLMENEALKRELEDLKVQSSVAISIVSENEKLKSLLGKETGTSSAYKNDHNISDRVLVPVLKHPPLVPYDEFIIDGGKDKNFAVGDNVYTPENIPIGTVADVFADTSKVILYSSPGKTYQVQIGTENTLATAIGRGGGQYSAELPQSVNISIGDLVTASSLNDRPFGVVSAVSSDPTQMFETVFFAPPVNIFQVRWVLVDTD